MKNVYVLLFSLMILVSSLAGCVGDESFDSSDLEMQISELKQENDKLNKTITEMNNTLQLLLLMHAQEIESLENNAQETGSDTQSSISAKISIITMIVANNSSSYSLTFELSPGSESINVTSIHYSLVCSDANDEIQIYADTFRNVILINGNGTLNENDVVEPGAVYMTLLEANNGTDDCSPNSSGEGQVSFMIQVQGGGSTYETLSISRPSNDGDVVV